jgi:Mrp family chromosome partitioning ATPase
LAQSLDIVLVVIESEKTEITSAERLVNRLSESDPQLIGIVLNKTKRYMPRILQRFFGQGEC